MDKDSNITTMLRMLLAFHILIVICSITSVVIIVTQWDSAFELACAFLLISAKVNSWSSSVTNCALTKLEARIRGVPEMPPFTRRLLKGEIVRDIFSRKEEK